MNNKYEIIPTSFDEILTTMSKKYELIPSAAAFNEDAPGKHQTSIVVKEICQDRLHFLDKTAARSQWDPGFWKRFPWLGFCALIVVLTCSTASYWVLLDSSHVAASRWAHGNTPPNLLLSVFNSIGNIAITVAVGQGVAIGWWRRALNGNTVRQLHYSWSFFTGASEIFTKFHYFNAIALAALMTKLAVVDGILYQKAASTYLNAFWDQKPIYVKTFLSSTFPITGIMGAKPNDGGSMTRDFHTLSLSWAEVIRDYYPGYVIDGCNGVSCKFGLEGLGFAADCSNTTTFVDYGLAIQPSKNEANKISSREFTLFSVNFTRTWPSKANNYSSIIVEMTYPDAEMSLNNTAIVNGSCPATLIKTTCELRPALMNYTLFYTNWTSKPKSRQNSKVDKLEDKTAWLKYDYGSPFSKLHDDAGIQLSANCEKYSTTDNSVTEDDCMTYDPSLRSIQGFAVIENADIVENHRPSGNSSLQGFFRSFQDALGSRAYLTYDSSIWTLQQQNPIFVGEVETPGTGYCNYSFRNPTDDVLYRVNSLAMLTLLHQDLYYDIITNDDGDDMYDRSHPKYDMPTSLLNNHTSRSLVTYQDVYYLSDLRYAKAALIATFVAVFCVLPVYWGFWELGRKVSLSPFEIANAFQGPAFAKVAGDDLEEVLKYLGNQRVAYGQVISSDGTRYAFKTLHND